MKICKALIIYLIFCMLVCSATLAQGGKAEPLAIKFKKGKSSAVLKGYVKGSEEAEYSFEANENQNLIIKLDSTPGNSALIRIQDPDSNELKLIEEQGSYKSKLPKTGEYFLVVTKKNNKNRNRTTYTFTLSIK